MSLSLSDLTFTFTVRSPSATFANTVEASCMLTIMFLNDAASLPTSSFVSASMTTSTSPRASLSAASVRCFMGLLMTREMKTPRTSDRNKEKTVRICMNLMVELICAALSSESCNAREILTSLIFSSDFWMAPITATTSPFIIARPSSFFPSITSWMIFSRMGSNLPRDCLSESISLMTSSLLVLLASFCRHCSIDWSNSLIRVLAACISVTSAARNTCLISTRCFWKSSPSFAKSIIGFRLYCMMLASASSMARSFRIPMYPITPPINATMTMADSNLVPIFRL